MGQDCNNNMVLMPERRVDMQDLLRRLATLEEQQRTNGKEHESILKSLDKIEVKLDELKDNHADLRMEIKETGWMRKLGYGVVTLILFTVFAAIMNLIIHEKSAFSGMSGATSTQQQGAPAAAKKPPGPST